MGARGPQKKPTALKLIEGNPGKQKLNKSEPAPPAPPKVPSPPKHLLPEAKKEWKRLAPALISLGVLTTVDLTAFGAMCQNYALYLAADKIVTTDGTDEKGAYKMFETDSGYMQQHPYITIRRQHYDNWRRSLMDFGLTPASRARIAIDETAKTKTSDPLENILNGTW